MSYLNEETALGGPFLSRKSTRFRVQDKKYNTFMTFRQVDFFFSFYQIKSLILCHFSLRLKKRVLVVCRVSNIVQDISGRLPVFLRCGLNQFFLQFIFGDFGFPRLSESVQYVSSVGQFSKHSNCADDFNLYDDPYKQT